MNKNDILLKIAIAEPSSIIRSGLAATLKRVQGFHIHAIEVSSPELLSGTIRLYKPDMVIISPAYCSAQEITKIKQESSNDISIRVVAVITGFFEDALKLRFDETIDLYDSNEQIQKKLEKLYNDPDIEEAQDETDALSQREKEILTGVVKGLTNKEIAIELFLSAHTVITHRRNISRKLGIHSTAGLTIYAITNKLIDIHSVNLE